MVALAKPQLIDLPALEPQGKSNEWYTPARYIEAARRVMGGIDLDPASCELANRTVKAGRYYTQEQDGLLQDWQAECVWCNPPYGTIAGKSSIGLCVKRLIDEYSHGRIKQAVLLVRADPGSAWFRMLWNYPICFVEHFVYFHRPNMTDEKHGFGTAFVYLGSNEAAFVDVFSQFGTIAKRVSTPRTKPAPLSLWGVSNV